MPCPSCGTENETGRKFCKECGGSLAVVCPSCGSANPPDARFCGECATRLQAPAVASTEARDGVAPAPGGAAVVAERRLVSVLFADLVGFTALAEGRDAEDARELLTRYVDLARGIVERHGGNVEKSIGDAVMAVWGTPIAHEDDAARAVRAGLEIVEAVGALGMPIGVGLAARAGVLTGEAAVTIGAVGQGMVAGDLVNTASRLQSVAAPGTVLVGASTQRAASRSIAFEPVGEQTLKGKTTPVPAWRAIHVLDERAGRSRQEPLEAPFVGRDDELRLLEDLFHATARERRSRLVSVFGPGGIGKTRLASEFLAYVDGLAEPVWWHDGRSPAYGEGITFWALGEMVRQRCGLVEGDDAATTRARVAETLAAHLPDPDERRWVEAALLTLLGLESGAATDQLFGAWRTFFERLAASAPVVLAFEDFHHADAGLVDFIGQLLDWSRHAPIYVLTLARPELLEKHPDWGAARRSFTSLFLDPLSPDAMRELLAGLVPGLPERAVEAIVGRADGVPLYAVETVRMLLAEGRLEVDEGAYRPTGDLRHLAVPETLGALIASRLDALPTADRNLVSDAAVLGQSFTLAALSDVAGVPEAGLEPHLAGLVRRELLRVEADPRSPECGQYAFVQALVREVAYRTLARRDRLRRHLAAARHLEAIGSDELASVVAGHYLAARESAPEGSEADALADRARTTLQAAADRASALGSNLQAVGFLEQALAVTDEPVTRAELLERAGTAAALANEHARARGLLEQAVALHRERGDRIAACRATTELVRTMAGRHREETLPIAEAAWNEFADLAEDPTGIALRAQLARLQFMNNRHAAAVATCDALLPSAERLDLVAIIADVLVTKGSALSGLGRRREGVGVMDTGRRLAETAELTFTVFRATVNAFVPIQAEDPVAGLAIAVRGLELAARSGMVEHMIDFQEMAAYAACVVGDWDAAVRRLTDGVEALAERDQVHLVAWCSSFAVLRGESLVSHLERIEALLVDARDDLTRAHGNEVRAVGSLATGQREDIESAISGLRDRFSMSDEDVEPIYWSILARVALWAHDAGAATAALERCRATPYRGRVLDAMERALESGIAAVEGRSDDALAGYRPALRVLDEAGVRWEAALVRLDMAMLLDPADPEVGAAASAARATFVELGAQPFIDRLDAALEGASTVASA